MSKPDQQAAVAPDPQPAPATDAAAAPEAAKPEAAAAAEEVTSTKSFEDMTSADLMNMSDEELAAIEASLATEPSVAPETQDQLPPTSTNDNGEVVDPNQTIDEKILQEIATATGQPAPAQPPAIPGQPAPQGTMPAAQGDPAPAQNEPSAEEKIAYLTGQLNALQARQADAVQQPQEDPAAHLTTQKQHIETTLVNLKNNHRTEREKLADMVDNGEINMREFIARDAELSSNVEGLQKTLNTSLASIDERLNAPDPAQVQQQILANPALKEWTGRLEAENPWVNHMTPEMVAALESQAKADMESLGLDTQSVDGVYNLRVRVVQLGKDMGYERVLMPHVQAAQQPAQAQPAGGVGAPAAPTPAPHSLQNLGSQPTPAQRGDKLDLAANHPPSIVSAGTSLPTDALSTAHLEGMTPAQLASALPSSTLDKLGEIA